MEAGREITNASTAIASHIRDLADLVEHVSTSEHEDTDQADGSPGISVLDDRKDVRPGLGKCAGNSEGRDDTNSPRNVVDRAFHSRGRAARQVASNPGVDLLGQ